MICVFAPARLFAPVSPVVSPSYTNNFTLYGGLISLLWKQTDNTHELNITRSWIHTLGFFRTKLSLKKLYYHSILHTLDLSEEPTKTCWIQRSPKILNKNESVIFFWIFNYLLKEQKNSWIQSGKKNTATADPSRSQADVPHFKELSRPRNAEFHGRLGRVKTFPQVFRAGWSVFLDHMELLSFSFWF